MTRTNKSTIGVIVVCLGIALMIDMRYAIDLTIALPIVLIPTGLYIALVPKRVEEYKPIVAAKTETEKVKSTFKENLNVFFTLVLGIILALFLSYAWFGILGTIVVVIVVIYYLISMLFEKRR